MSKHVQFGVDWSQQHCGVHHATIEQVCENMPDLNDILKSFPDDPYSFTWDVKVHMLMPGQFPCIPHWHTDNVPRIGGVQRFDLCDLSKPMYLWVSGGPLTQFKHGFVEPGHWHRFNQADEHRGIAASDNCWRGFIRATHRDLMPPKGGDVVRRHTQVYLDSNTYQW